MKTNATILESVIFDHLPIRKRLLSAHGATMASTTTTTEPPYYILVSHSTLVNTTGGTSPTSLGHPIIQYHYADDSPLSLLPHTADEHVLVLDYDNVATMKSISKNLAVTGIKVSEAPGAAAAHDELKIERNDKIYILETCTTMEDRCALLILRST